jgi:hypothetical protein
MAAGRNSQVQYLRRFSSTQLSLICWEPTAAVILLQNDATAGPAVERRLSGTAYDCVVIGAGVRLPPKNLLLFEAIINAAHKPTIGQTKPLEGPSGAWLQTREAVDRRSPLAQVRGKERLDLLVQPHARRMRISNERDDARLLRPTRFRGPHPFRGDFGRARGRNPPWTGRSVARQGRQKNAIGNLQIANLQGVEQVRH